MNLLSFIRIPADVCLGPLSSSSAARIAERR
jgi:hypothetical protein